MLIFSSEFLDKNDSTKYACLADLRSTDPRDDKKRIEDMKGGLLKDSYKWILEHQDFRQWRDNDQSRLLWIKGDPGKGKTMLLCGIIDDLSSVTPQDCRDHRPILSYFFCQATDSRINNATAVLRGLIYILVDRQPSLLSHIRERYDKAGKALFEDPNAWITLSEVLTKILKDPSLITTYIIIDALDECITDLPKLLKFIVKCSTANPAVKWIVSSRNRTDIEKGFEATHEARLSLELNKESVSAAVDAYIDFKIRSLSEKHDYESNTKDAIRRHLTSKANGTFLWIALVCQQLDDLSEWEINDESLAVFPPGLDTLYQLMMDHIRDSRHAKLCQKVLAALSIMQRPINLYELAVLVEVPPGASNNHKALSEIIGYCGSFLTLSNQTIFFVHQSAQDFLLTEKIATQIFPFGRSEAHQTIFARSIKTISQKLSRDIYDLQRPGIYINQVRQPQPDPLAAVRYSCIYWVDHLLETKSDNRLQDIESFLRQSYLYWLEVLSLLRSIPRGVRALAKLKGKVQVR